MLGLDQILYLVKQHIKIKELILDSIKEINLNVKLKTIPGDKAQIILDEYLDIIKKLDNIQDIKLSNIEYENSKRD